MVCFFTVATSDNEKQPNSADRTELTKNRAFTLHTEMNHTTQHRISVFGASHSVHSFSFNLSVPLSNSRL